MTEHLLNEAFANNAEVMQQQHWDQLKSQSRMIPEQLSYPIPSPGIFTTSEANKQFQQPTQPTPEYVFQSRVQGVAHPDKERQRTIQACDKCRERKTKCSGDRPVCQRCTARGLICNYSNREPRTRGPSKARLRNAVSSTDLRSTVKSNGISPQNSQQGWPAHAPSGVSRHYRNLSANYGNGIQRAPSLPSSRYDQFRSRIQPGEVFDFTSLEHWQEPYSPFNSLFNTGDIENPQFSSTNSFQNQAPIPYISQIPQPVAPPRDVRRVQSHSALQGKTRLNLQPALDPALAKSSPLLNPPPKSSFNQPFYSPTDEHLSPDSHLQPLSHMMQRGHSPYIEHLSHVNPDIQLNWGYHSDTGSTGSDGMDHHLMSSPSTSSEGMPEPTSRGASSMGAPSPEPFDFLSSGTGISPAPVYTGIEPSQNMSGDMFATFPSNRGEAPAFSTSPNDQQIYGGFINPDNSHHSFRAALPQYDEKGQQIFHD